MTPGIAPDMLIVNKRPSPCWCTEDTICEFCVQANLIAWERAEARGKKSRPGRLVKTLQKLRKGPVSEALGVSRQTAHKMLKSKKIPPKYARRFHRHIARCMVG